MNRLKNIGILSILGILFYIVFFSGNEFNCIFKENLGIYCPACGMTRAFIEIMNFNLLAALSYNLLSVPLFLCIIYSIFALIIDIITGKTKFLDGLLSFFKDYYWLIIILLFVNMLVNNVRFNQ